MWVALGPRWFPRVGALTVDVAVQMRRTSPWSADKQTIHSMLGRPLNQPKLVK